MWKQKAFDVVVVGGGPAGSTFAHIAAKGGLSVLLLEKDRDIGIPVRCGEAVSAAGLQQFHEPRERWIKSVINRIRLVAPNETVVEFDLKEKGYILDRRIFDFDLAQMAAEEGALIITKAYVNGLIIEDNWVVGVKGLHLNQPFEVRAKLVVGADGVESRVGRWAGLKTHLKLKNMESAIQMTVSGIDINPRMFEFYLSKKWAPGGYLWVFPKGNRSANIGLGISGKYAKDGKAAHQFLDEFLEWKYPQASVLTTVAGGVPVDRPLKQMVTNGLMLVGDAAHMVNPLTGGGITAALRSGLLAAETAQKIIKNGKDISRRNLRDYEKRWYKIGGKRQERYYRIKETIFRFSDTDLDRIATGIAAVPEEDRTLLKLFSVAVSKKPSLLIDVAKLFAGV